MSCILVRGHLRIYILAITWAGNDDLNTISMARNFWQKFKLKAKYFCIDP